MCESEYLQTRIKKLKSFEKSRNIEKDLKSYNSWRTELNRECLKKISMSFLESGSHIDVACNTTDDNDVLTPVLLQDDVLDDLAQLTVNGLRDRDDSLQRTLQESISDIFAISAAKINESHKSSSSCIYQLSSRDFGAAVEREGAILVNSIRDTQMQVEKAQIKEKPLLRLARELGENKGEHATNPHTTTNPAAAANGYLIHFLRIYIVLIYFSPIVFY